MLVFYKDGKLIDNKDFSRAAENRKVILFGASKKNELFFEAFPSIPIKYIFDNDKEKWGTKNCAIPVVQPFPKEEEALLVSGVQDWFAISKQVNELGYYQLYFFLETEESEVLYGAYLDAFYPFVWHCEEEDMTAIRYVHVIPDQKFFLPVMEMIEYAFDMREHFFYIYSINASNPGDIYHIWDQYKRLSDQYGNIYIQHEFGGAGRTVDEIRHLEDIVLQSEKIIFHGEFLNSNVKEFFVRQLEEVKKKGVYLPWSGLAGTDPATNKYIGELLQHVRIVVTNVDFIKENIRKKFVNNPKTVWMTNGLSYARKTEPIRPKEKKTKNVFIGHSAYDYSRQMETLEDLTALKALGDDATIYCIVSYGEKRYIQRLLEKGTQYFGSRFCAITTYLDYKEYVDLLKKMDIALIGMEVMAGRNTLELLFWSRVKVYLKPGTDVYRRMRSMGYKINDYNRIFEESEESLFFNRDEEWNCSVAAREFDIDLKVRQWRELYEYPL